MPNALGGPALQVSESNGVKEPASPSEQVVQDMTAALCRVAEDRVLLARPRESCTAARPPAVHLGEERSGAERSLRSYMFMWRERTVTKKLNSLARILGS